jgi:transposase
MIGLSRSVRVFVWREPVDMRKSYDGLSGIVVEQMGRALAAGDVYLFVGKDRRRAKALTWDGTGVCVYAKRLAKGRFAAPWDRGVGEDVVFTLTEMNAFFEGAELALRVRISPAEHRPEQDRLRFG